MGSVHGKVALITGGANGIGEEVARRLHAKGAKLILTDLDEDKLRNVGARLGADRVLTVTADVRDLMAMQAAADQGIERFGGIDIVVANAGIFSLGAATELSDRAWQDVLDVNLTGAWHTAKATVPHVVAGGRGGSIIFVSSMAALRPPLGLAHYSASKAGVVALMKTLAAELGPQFIRVNTVNPATVDTPMIDNDTILGAFMPELERPTRDDAAKPDSAFVRINALPVPWLQVQDVTNAVEFLASDAARLITGVALPIDAGFQVKS